MNADKVLTALTIYVGKQSKSEKLFTCFRDKLYSSLTQLFIENKNVIYLFLITHFLFVFLGSCISSIDTKTYFYAHSIVVSQDAIPFVIIALIFVSTFAFSTFGKSISLILQCVLSFFYSILFHVAKSDFTLSYNTTLSIFLLIILFSFLNILLFIKCFIFSKSKKSQKRSVDKIPPILSHLFFCIIDIYLIFLIYRKIIYLMVG